MNVNVEIDTSISETTIIIKTNSLSDKLNDIVLYLNNFDNLNIIGYKDGKLHILKKEDIETIYSEGNNVFAFSNNQVYMLKNRIYELEHILGNYGFIRISNSELLNFNKVKTLDLNITGTIQITLESGKYTYCSRRKIKTIKKFLNIK